MSAPFRMTASETALAAFKKHWPQMEGCAPDQVWLAACLWTSGQVSKEILEIARHDGLTLRPHSGAMRALQAVRIMLSESVEDIRTTCNRIGREDAEDPPAE